MPFEIVPFDGAATFKVLTNSTSVFASSHNIDDDDDVGPLPSAFECIHHNINNRIMTPKLVCLCLAVVLTLGTSIGGAEAHMNLFLNQQEVMRLLGKCKKCSANVALDSRSLILNAFASE